MTIHRLKSWPQYYDGLARCRVNPEEVTTTKISLILVPGRFSGCCSAPVWQFRNTDVRLCGKCGSQVIPRAISGRPEGSA